MQRGLAALGGLGLVTCGDELSVEGVGGRHGGCRVAYDDGGGGGCGEKQRPMGGGMAAGPGMWQDALPVSASRAVAVTHRIEFLEYRSPSLHAIPLTLQLEMSAAVHTVSFSTVFRTRMLTVRMVYNAPGTPSTTPPTRSGAPPELM
ncbi:hypothetical protein GCM10018780_74060 [Streptomyces lanatus]|nr:hypothetical protein GCM10018780_74060 [Streptomyces lanatus]